MHHTIAARTLPVALAVCLMAFTTGTRAEGGLIGFTGAIIEATCVMRDHRPDCPPGHPAAATVHVLDDPQALADIHAALLDHALRRDPAAHWKVVDTTYR
ncbi:hypothetical protein [Xanthomonas sp. NCPPB 2632]|jgi:hypothetical protein|uniref:hypothetical protein n=1 Tax=Xanthomonas sp. NCPPB 2632 TaxID=3240912 RepID=UPI0035156FB9